MLIDALKLNQMLSGDKRCKFASFQYINSHGELSQYTVLLNVDYRRCVEEDIAFLSKYRPENELQREARDQLLSSFSSFLNGNSKSTKKDYYDSAGKTVKVAKETGMVYIVGMVLSKKVIVPAPERKKTNSSALTVEKNKLRKLLKSTRYREFKLDSPFFEIKANGETIEINVSMPQQDVDISTETVHVGTTH